MPTTTDETREARKRVALKTLCNTGRPRVAAQAAGVSLRTLQRWRHEDPNFAGAWIEAEQVASFAVYDEVVRRGVEGVEKPVFYKGKQVGSVTEYSDTLLLAVARALIPSFRSKFHVQVEDLSRLSDEELVAQIASLEATLTALALN